MLNVATLKVVLVKCDLLRLVFGGLDWPYQFFSPPNGSLDGVLLYHYGGGGGGGVKNLEMVLSVVL